MPSHDARQIIEATRLRDYIEDKFFVAGQMDAQGTAAEKRKIGSGGPVLALSKRLLADARSSLDALFQRAEQAEAALARLAALTPQDQE
jgi:hypothetical protein